MSIDSKLKELVDLAKQLKGTTLEEEKKVSDTDETEDEKEIEGSKDGDSEIVLDGDGDGDGDGDDSDCEDDGEKKVDEAATPVFLSGETPVKSKEAKKITRIANRISKAVRDKYKPSPGVVVFSKDKVQESEESEEETMDQVDVTSLFEGENLSEEFKTEFTALFEAAVNARVKSEMELFVESFTAEALNESEQLEEGLVNKVDGYLDYMVEKWMEENELEITSSIKNDIFESFLTDMKAVFENHYIDVPDEKYDLVEAIESENETLRAQLDEQREKTERLEKAVAEVEREMAIDEACEGMVATDSERFRALAEELAFTNSEEFNGKLATLKENYFGELKKDDKKVITEEFITDTPVEVVNESVAPKTTPEMSQYLRVLGR